MDETPEEGLPEVAAELNELATRLVRHLLSDRQGMSLTTVAVLGRLGQEGPIRLTALAAAEGIAQPSMTALVQRLERQGLVSRSADPTDGRVCLVAITDAGHELLSERRRAQRARVTGLLAELPEQDVHALSEAVHTALPIVRRMLRDGPSPRATLGGAAS
ncbi:MarR family winged helix-turn-helix transcriptional regulator [Kitasatospora sp. NPDC058190]|uniref:MarR family winged helix-turn-helix transcriptional regulator n=1 Tax=Kitasatospora sp. NPDC058190 TaxID=3346371 RepID=UPI0036D81961